MYQQHMLLKLRKPILKYTLNKYEGRSICNENSPVYPKVLYLHTTQLLLLKGLFLG